MIIKVKKSKRSCDRKLVMQKVNFSIRVGEVFEFLELNDVPVYDRKDTSSYVSFIIKGAS